MYVVCINLIFVYNRKLVKNVSKITFHRKYVAVLHQKTHIMMSLSMLL